MEAELLSGPLTLPSLNPLGCSLGTPPPPPVAYCCVSLVSRHPEIGQRSELIPPNLPYPGLQLECCVQCWAPARGNHRITAVGNDL